VAVFIQKVSPVVQHPHAPHRGNSNS
jgi:hypothetical protein